MKPPSISELEARIAQCESAIAALTKMQDQLGTLGTPIEGRSQTLNRHLVTALRRSLDYYRAALASARAAAASGSPTVRAKNPPFATHRPRNE